MFIITPDRIDVDQGFVWRTSLLGTVRGVRATYARPEGWTDEKWEAFVSEVTEEIARQNAP